MSESPRRRTSERPSRRLSVDPTPDAAAEEFKEELNNANFGQKDIAMFSGVVLLINNITGPGIPGLPNMFAEAGWLIPTLVLLAVWGMTSLSSCMFAEAMANIPGNDKFQVSRLPPCSLGEVTNRSS